MIAILRFLGTNCEFDIQYATQFLGKDSAIVWHKETALPRDTNAVIVPGGFSYGDYLRCGGIAKFAPIMKAVRAFAENGGFVFGICNGFQILCEAKMLPGVLMRNKHIAYKSIMGEFEVCNNDNILLQNYGIRQKIRLPIAHAEGNYYIDDDGLARLRANNQILLTYTSDINGSIARIAGICNENKNVFGMMPHPERAIEKVLGSDDGANMLANIFSANAPKIDESSAIDSSKSRELDESHESNESSESTESTALDSPNLAHSGDSLNLTANYHFNN